MLTRREFSLGALATFAFARSLPAAVLRPFSGHWLADLDALGRAVQSQKLPQVEWQAKVEDLFAKVPLEDFLKYIDFPSLEKKGK